MVEAIEQCGFSVMTREEGQGPRRTPPRIRSCSDWWKHRVGPKPYLCLFQIAQQRFLNLRRPPG